MTLYKSIAGGYINQGYNYSPYVNVPVKRIAGRCYSSRSGRYASDRVQSEDSNACSIIPRSDASQSKINQKSGVGLRNFILPLTPRKNFWKEFS